MSIDIAALRSLLEEERLVPVLRASSESTLREQVARVIEAGLQIIEVTATSPGWERVLGEVAGSPGLTVGAGTVRTPQLAQAAAAAGAEFLVAPCAVPEVRQVVALPLIEGGFTPTELHSLCGPDRIAKLFPAATGGVQHLRALLDVAPGSAVLPTGGIRPGDAASWIEAGAVAVGLGSALIGMPAVEIRRVQRELRRVRR